MAAPSSVALFDSSAITQSDVLLGRGTSCSCHVGSLAFKVVVVSRLDSYQQSKSANCKTRLIKDIINTVERSGGRFLIKLVQATGKKRNRYYTDDAELWHEVSKKDAHVKVRDTLRDCIKSVRKYGYPSALLDKVGLSETFGRYFHFRQIVEYMANSSDIRFDVYKQHNATAGCINPIEDGDAAKPFPFSTNQQCQETAQYSKQVNVQHSKDSRAVLLPLPSYGGTPPAIGDVDVSAYERTAIFESWNRDDSTIKAKHKAADPVCQHIQESLGPASHDNDPIILNQEGAKFQLDDCFDCAISEINPMDVFLVCHPQEAGAVLSLDCSDSHVNSKAANFQSNTYFDYSNMKGNPIGGFVCQAQDEHQREAIVTSTSLVPVVRTLQYQSRETRRRTSSLCEARHHASLTFARRNFTTPSLPNGSFTGALDSGLPVVSEDSLISPRTNGAGRYTESYNYRSTLPHFLPSTEQLLQQIDDDDDDDQFTHSKMVRKAIMLSREGDTELLDYCLLRTNALLASNRYRRKRELHDTAHN